MFLYTWCSFAFPRILAPTMYIFFASALPVIAFGEQLSRDTGASCNVDKIWFVLNFVSINWKRGSYFNLFIILIVLRWKIEHCGNISLNCAVWNYPLNLWGTAFADFRCGRTNSYNVHLLVHFLPRPARFRRRALYSLGWMVGELVFQISVPSTHILLEIQGFAYFFRMSVIGCASGQDYFWFSLQSLMLATSLPNLQE